MSKIPTYIYVLVVCIVFSSYWIFKKDPKEVHRAFYIWESSKEQLTDFELKSLKKLKVRKIYLKFFEVEKNEVQGIHPTAKSEFYSSNFSDSIEIIPTVYVRNEVFKNTKNAELDEFADNLLFLIKKRFPERPNQDKSFHEIQIDCDWTESTQEKYFYFLKKLKEKSSLILSATLRLYAYKFPDRMGVLPVDKAMLMCYNLLNIHENRDKNSILDLQELEKYLDGASAYPLPLDLALPIYSAMHVYQNKVYQSSLHKNDCDITGDLKKRNNLWYSVNKDIVKSTVYLRVGDQVKYEKITPELLKKALKMIHAYVELPKEYTLSFFQLNEYDLKQIGNEKMDSFYTMLP